MEEETLAAIKVDNNSNALIKVIPLKQSNDIDEEGEEDSPTFLI